jgi:myo-inositol-1(or 4)-monophosphatase
MPSAVVTPENAQPIVNAQVQMRYAEYLTFALQLAAESAAIARAQYGASLARRKSDGSLVTQTDEQIDRLISQRVAETYPGDTVLSEEQATLFDPAVGRTWIIDPIDGTTNFARGIPTWGISIAVIEGLRPVAAVLEFPMLEERFVATLGGGAERNGVAIHTAAGEPCDDAHIFMECSRTRRQSAFDLPFKSRMLGSAAYHICKVADGSAIAGSEATPKVWDLAAAALILDESGGVMQTVAGDAVFPLASLAADYKFLPYVVLYAADATALQAVRGAMRAVAPSEG